VLITTPIGDYGGDIAGDDGQPDLPSGGQAELPGGGQRDWPWLSLAGGGRGT
jgi:hypothetical protein